jgi:hypothetical protein
LLYDEKHLFFSIAGRSYSEVQLVVAAGVAVAEVAL